MAALGYDFFFCPNLSTRQYKTVLESQYSDTQFLRKVCESKSRPSSENLLHFLLRQAESLQETVMSIKIAC